MFDFEGLRLYVHHCAVPPFPPTCEESFFSPNPGCRVHPNIPRPHHRTTSPRSSHVRSRAAAASADPAAGPALLLCSLPLFAVWLSALPVSFRHKHAWQWRACRLRVALLHSRPLIVPRALVRARVVSQLRTKCSVTESRVRVGAGAND